MRRRRIAAVLVMAAAAVPAAAAAGAPARHPDAASFQLPARPTMGQMAQVSVIVDTQLAGTLAQGALSLDLGVAREVAGVDTATGAFSTRSVIADVAVSQAPVGIDVSLLESVRSISIVQRFDSTGTALGPSEAENPTSTEQANGGRHVLDLMAATTIGYPNEPVEVGASWLSPGAAADTSGISVAVEYQCRLVSVEGRSFVIEVSFAQEFSAADPVYGQIDGTISGQGTLQGSLDNVLVMNGALNQTVDGIATVDGATAPLSITSTIQIASG